MILSLVVLSIVLHFGRFQLTSVTIPEQINGGSPIVSATEDALDIKVVCEIFNGDIPFITDWRLIMNGNPTLLRFFSNGTASDSASQNFSVTGEPTGSQTTSSNLTILKFSRTLDQNILECFTGGITLGNFTLRLIGENVLFTFVYAQVCYKMNIMNSLDAISICQ